MTTTTRAGTTAEAARARARAGDATAPEGAASGCPLGSWNLGRGRVRDHSRAAGRRAAPRPRAARALARARETAELAGADAPEPVGSAAGARILVAVLLEALRRAALWRRRVVLRRVGRASAGVVVGPSSGSVSVAGSTVVVVGRRSCPPRAAWSGRRRGRERQLGQLAGRAGGRLVVAAAARDGRRRAAAAGAGRARSALDGRKPPAAVGAVVQVVLDAAARASSRTGAGSRPRRGGRSATGPAAARLPTTWNSSPDSWST